METALRDATPSPATTSFVTSSSPGVVAAPPLAVRSSAAGLRLRRHVDFQRVYNATKKQHAKQMSYFAAVRDASFVEDAAVTGPRVGLTVGKVMGKAPTRNRIKRRLREAVRAEQAALGGLPVDVVLHPRKSVETLPYPELRAEVAWVFRRVRKGVEGAVKAPAPLRAGKPVAVSTRNDGGVGEVARARDAGKSEGAQTS